MKKFIASFVVFGFLLSMPGAQASFSDVRSGSQLESYIDVLVGKGILSGYPDGTFKPERTINRAEALKILFETIGSDAGESTNSGFPDVPSSEWFAKYVTAAKRKNIVAGYPDGKFQPTQEVNRAEFIKIVMSALPFFSSTPQDKSVAMRQYADVYDLWYTPYVSAGLQLGFLNTTNELKPTAPMQRQDAVEIVYRISKYLEENPSSLAESDIPYVPEEAFTVVDPTESQSDWSKQYHAQDFGPDKLIVKKDIGRTDIFNIYHGYNLIIDEIVHVRANSQNYDNVMSIDYPNGCVVDVYTYKNKYSSAQDYFEKDDPGEDGMFRASKRDLKKISSYPGLNVFEITTEWDLDAEALEYLGMDKITTSVFVYQNNTVYLLNAHSPSADEKICEALIPKVMSKFPLR